MTNEKTQAEKQIHIPNWQLQTLRHQVGCIYDGISTSKQKQLHHITSRHVICPFWLRANSMCSSLSSCYKKTISVCDNARRRAAQYRQGDYLFGPLHQASSTCSFLHNSVQSWPSQTWRVSISFTRPITKWGQTPCMPPRICRDYVRNIHPSGRLHVKAFAAFFGVKNLNGGCMMAFHSLLEVLVFDDYKIKGLISCFEDC